MPGPVVLVGLMGSGKTTVGRRLAGLLDRPFADADQVLEERAGRSVAEIFAADGEAAFRDLEADVLAWLLAAPAPGVVASGGGVVLRQANRERLAADDVTVVWLDAGPAFLASRVERKAHRPLLAGDEPAAEVLDRLHAERVPLYAEVADVVVDVEPFHRDEERPKRALAERIAALVRAHEGAAVAAATEGR
ncbi:MAG: shikimate kinase [Acidimicrobiales bacterium]|nr:shikimate kinase [Acidimicrobiales bacterium]